MGQPRPCSEGQNNLANGAKEGRQAKSHYIQKGEGLTDAQSIQEWPHPTNKSSPLVAHTNGALPERRPGTAASLTLHGEEHGLADVCANPVAGLAQVIADVFF